MNEQKKYFSRKLLFWYRANKRDLPWRRRSNPYYTWVSEIMLQQTRVETVKPYFERFVNQFPTIGVLADAPEEEVLKAWEGLGYYSRARNLQAAAREVKELYGGQVPNDKGKVSALKGVGPYTSGAIMSIAFNQPEPAVDGNVMRVLSRYFRLHDDVAKPSTRRHMENLAQGLIPDGCAAEFNQGLMELGALICMPKSPACSLCPVMEYCAGHKAGEERVLPVKTKSKPPKPELRYAALIEGSGEHAGKVLVRRRPDMGLLAKMWELPHILVPEQVGIIEINDVESQAILHHALLGEGIDVIPVEHCFDAEHTFSHIHWQMRAYRCMLRSLQSKGNTVYIWLGLKEMKELAFPSLFIRLLNDYFQ